MKFRISQEHYQTRLVRIRKLVDLRLTGSVPDEIIADVAMSIVNSFDLTFRDRWKFLRMLFRGHCKCLMCK